MKTRLLKFIIIACLFFTANIIKAQEVAYSTSNTFYWNPFETAAPASSIGTFAYPTGTTSANYTVVSASTPAALNGSYSLTTVNRSTPLAGRIYKQILPSAGSFSSSVTYEWSLLYKYTTSDATNASDIVDYLSVTAGKSGWRYWLAANNTTPSATGGLGLYLTQVGETLYFYSKQSDSYTALVSSTTLTPNTTYSIKCRVINGSIFILFVNPYSTSQPNATTEIGSANFSASMSSFSYTVLENNEARPSTYNCQWDDFKLYTPTILVSPITALSNGLSNNPLAQGQSNAIVYGFSITSRGVFNIENLSVSDGLGNSQQNLSAAELYSSPDNNFSTSSDSPILAFSVPSGGTLSGTYALNLGGADQNGTTTYYFFTVSLAANSLFSGQTIQFSNLVLNYNNYNGYITATSSPSAGTAYTISQAYTWTGSTNTDWGTNTNWTLAQLYQSNSTPSTSPPTGAYAYVPNSAGNNPIVASGTNVSLGGLTIENNRTVTLTASDNLTVNSNLTAPGTLAFTGTGSDTFTLTSGANASLGNLSITKGALANTVTLASGNALLNLTGTLSVATATLVTNSALTLKSSATSTANVAQLTSTTAAISGNVNVERYMTGGNKAYRGYRLLSSPVNQGVLFTSGPLGYGFTALQKTTPITGYGASGTYSATVPTNGFDPSPNANPSIFYYYEPNADPTSSAISNSDYKGLASISTELPIGNGFLFFFRGDRAITDSAGNLKTSASALPENTVLNYTGALNQGSISVNIPKTTIAATSGTYVTPTGATQVTTSLSYTAHTSSTNDGLHLIGNPYASPIDLDKVTLTSPYNLFIYMLNNTGTFGVYKQGSATSYTSSSLLNNGVGRYVLSGQGFFVTGNASGTSTVSFAETCKVSPIPGSGTPTTFASRTSAAHTDAVTSSTLSPQIIHVLLSLDSLNANEAVIQFGDTNAKNKFDRHEDAYYMNGISQTTFMASYTSDLQPCLINEMGSLDSIKTIPLYAEGTTTGLYKMQFSGMQSIDPRYKIYLKDNLLKDSLDLSANNLYNFNIDRSNSQTYGASRFSLVIYPTGIANYYHLNSFTGVKNPNSAALTWATQYEGNYTTFTLQRSIDGGKTFSNIATMQSDGTGSYNYTDANPSKTQVNQYRLQQNNADSVNSFSNLVNISYLTVNSETNKLIIYPNPVSDVIHISIVPDNNAVIFIKVYDISGNKMIDSEFPTNSTFDLDVSKLKQGDYIITVKNSNNKNYGSARFIKN